MDLERNTSINISPGKLVKPKMSNVVDLTDSPPTVPINAGLEASAVLAQPGGGGENVHTANRESVRAGKEGGGGKRRGPRDAAESSPAALADQTSPDTGL